MIKKQTTLDINGPVLSFSQQPVSISTCNVSVAATFVGVAIATFPDQSPSNPATGTGYISYQWYLEGYGALTDTDVRGSRIVGSATTTLTIYSPKSPTISGSQVYLQADYIPSAYVQPFTSEVTAGTARSTGNAVIDPLHSNKVFLTVYPTVHFSSQPVDRNIPLDTEIEFSVSVNSSDNTIGETTYNWQINGADINSENFNATYYTPASQKYLTIQDSVTQSRTVVRFSDIASYSDFITGREYTIVPNEDVQVKIFAVGGGGGEETYRGTQGGRGGSTNGTITLKKEQVYKLIVGGGAANATGGYGGGGNGSPGGAGGVSGGGGGYTGLFIDSVSHSNAILIAGGGGGAANGPAQGGSGGGTNGGDASNVSGNGGTGGTQSAGGTGGVSGSELQGGSGSAAGGGGGYYGGGSGIFSSGCCSDGAGGGGSGYINSTLISNGSFTSTLESAGGGNSGKDGSFKLLLDTTTGTSNVTASGYNTPTLKVSSKSVGIFPIRCRVLHSLSCDSPIYSRTANFNSIVPRDILNFEYIETLGTSSADLYSVDLGLSGCVTLTGDNTNGKIVSFYAPEKDIVATIDMYGSKGSDAPGYSGGEGGTSLIRHTLKRNTEYVLAPLPFSNANGGLYLYEKSQLLASVGSGGNAGTTGNGGNGGGVNIAGSNGSGRGAGNGGQSIQKGTLQSSGYFPGYWTDQVINPDTVNTTANGGGRTISCTRGDYWRDQGFSSCQEIGKQKFVRSDGFVVQNTNGEIDRGFKSGYSIRQTSGRGENNGGNGGFGVVGGDGGLNGAGGGGASGYENGSSQVLRSNSGGNKSQAKVVICSNSIAGFINWGGTNGRNITFTGNRLKFTAPGNGNGYQTYSSVIPTGNVYFDVYIDGGYSSGQIGFLGVCNTTNPITFFDYEKHTGWYWRAVWHGRYQGTAWATPGYFEKSAPNDQAPATLDTGTYRIALDRIRNRLYMKRLNPESQTGFIDPLPTGELRLELLTQFFPASDGYPQMGCEILNDGAVYVGNGGLYE